MKFLTKEQAGIRLANGALLAIIPTFLAWAMQSYSLIHWGST